jgi:hypothetical protein
MDRRRFVAKVRELSAGRPCYPDWRCRYVLGLTYSDLKPAEGEHTPVCLYLDFVISCSQLTIE